MQRNVARPGSASDAMLCPGCRAVDMTPFFELSSVPVFCNVLWRTRAEALAVKRGRILLAHCAHCDLVYNVAFDPSRLDYDEGYENSLDFSAHFQNYARQLALRLVDDHGVRGGTVVEIGCGQGAFLELLCAAGDNRGIGFDPAYSRTAPLPPSMEIRSERFSATDVEADLICCRHVLEHLDAPLDFLIELRRGIGERRPVVFFEVPNALWTLQHGGIWDLIYEHCSYFTPPSLARLFERAGFELIRIEETYGNQFLTLEATPGSPSPRVEGGNAIGELVAMFAPTFAQMAGEWRQRLTQSVESGERVALWGGGSKGVCFLNVMEADHALIPFIVDVNPHKHGKYVPGTGQQVIPPEELEDYRPTMIIVMNPVYAGEIRRIMQVQGIDCPILTATPGSREKVPQ